MSKSNGGRQTYTADSGFRDRGDRGIARNLSQYTGSNQGPQYYQDITQNNQSKEGALKSAGGIGPQFQGVQASHLGVYRHDTSISLMKPNMSQN